MDKFTQSMDAELWADEFCKLNPAADNETMIGWFANAIMRGYDSGMVKGREQGMREAAAIVHSREAAKEIAMHVRPYEPISAENVALLMEDCHDACVAIHLTILAAIEAKP